MRIDESHRKWAFVSSFVLVAATLAYIPYAVSYRGGPRGNTLPGLIYGILGYGMMLFAGLMGARRRVPLWRVGRASSWMRGHLWLGVLSLPMILFHSAFAARGPLTMVLMILLIIVVLSGVTGAILQHVMPTKMTSAVRMETIWEQIPHIREQLLAQASGVVERCSPEAGTGQDENPRLRTLYVSQIMPFLRHPDAGDSPLADAVKAAAFFQALRRQSAPAFEDALNELEAICEEERQLTRQHTMYFWLHAWLLIHVPLSITLLVLGGIHALVAIRY